MKIRFALKPHAAACVSTVALVFAAGCTVLGNRPNTATPGSTWLIAVRNTGSFGTQNIETRTRAGGERMWQGRRVFVYERPGNPQGDIVTEPGMGGWIALAKGDSPILSFDPPLGWKWPLVVGKSWSTKHRATNHATKRSGDFVGSWNVESYGPVTVRAGTFDAYKIVYTDTAGSENTSWWSPDLGVNVKSSSRRTAKHGAGPGTSELELVSRPTM